MEVDAVGAELGELVHARDRVERRAHLGAERIAAPVADRPQSEREVVLGPGRVAVAHGRPPAHAHLILRAVRLGGLLPRCAASLGRVMTSPLRARLPLPRRS